MVPGCILGLNRKGQLQRQSFVKLWWTGHGRRWGQTVKNATDDSLGIWFGYFQSVECTDPTFIEWEQLRTLPNSEHVCSCKSKLTGVLGSNVPTAHGKWQHHCGFIAWMLVTSRDLNWGFIALFIHLIKKNQFSLVSWFCKYLHVLAFINEWFCWKY